MTSGITRRRLLQAMGMTSASMLLTGCKTVPSLGSTLGNMMNQAMGNGSLKKVNTVSNGLKPWTPEDQTKAERAKWVLDHLQQTGSLPWVATDNAYPDQLAAFGQTWQRIIEESLRKGEISFEDYLTLALGVSPLLAQSARQNEGEFPPVPAAPATLQQGKLTLAPGAKARFKLDGCCMDDELIAPAQGEPLTIRPIDGYIHPQLLELYRGVTREYVAGRLSFTDYQHLVWAIRNVETKDTPYIANLQPKHVDALDRAVPGGANLLRRTHMLASNNPMDDIADGLRTALTESLSSLQLNVNGQTFTPMTLMQQGNTDQAIEGILSSLTGREPVERLPVSDLSDFTVLDNGLVIQCHAEERLSPGFTIANPTSQPLEFDPTGFVAESRRNTQRLTVPFLTDNVSIRVEAPGFSANLELESFAERTAKDFGHFMLDKSLSNSERTAQGLVVDPTNHLGSHLRKISTPVGAVWSHMMERELFGKVVKRIISTPAYARLRTEASWVQFIGEMTGRDFVLAARGGAEFLPVVGNMLSLYEAYYGHPLLEPDNRSSLPERGLALIGTIPGGRVATQGVEGAVRAAEILGNKARRMLESYTNNTLIRTGLEVSEGVGERLADGARTMARNYANSSSLRQVEASEFYRDIAWWGLSNAHQELAVAVDNHFNTPMTNEWRETIDFVKSL